MNAETMTAKLGGAFIIEEHDEAFAEQYHDIGFVFVDLPSGERLQLFYNNETRLFVADVIAEDESVGIEFVRCTVPTP